MTCTIGAAKPATLEDILAAVAAIEAIGPEPIGQWMREQGHPPETYDLILPYAIFHQFFPDLPPPLYVRKSGLIDCALFIARPWQTIPLSL